MVSRITYWMENRNEVVETCLDLRVSEKYREILVSPRKFIPVEYISEYLEFEFYLKKILKGIAKIQGYKLMGVTEIGVPEEEEY